MKRAALLIAGATLLIAAPEARAQDSTSAPAPAVVTPVVAPRTFPVNARAGIDRIRQRMGSQPARQPVYIIMMPQATPPATETIRYVPVPYPVSSGTAPPPASYTPPPNYAPPASTPPPTVVRVPTTAPVLELGVPEPPDSAETTRQLPRVGAPARTGQIDELPVADLPEVAVRTVREVERSLFETGLFRAVGINFETGKSQLLDGASVLVDPVGDVLRRYPDLSIEVAGHTDTVGSEALNQRLSEARAQTIVTYLTERWGIDPARLVAKGYGETQPFVTNDNPTGRTLNRRVEFRVLGEEQ